jgi:integrase
MAILAECPFCHKKQSTKNKLCACGADLDKAKKTKKVRFWIAYRMPGEKNLRRESVGFSIEDARDAESKRRVQKKEKRFLDMLPGTDMTFKELAKWYLPLESVKGLRSYERLCDAVNNFLEDFGDKIVGEIKQEDLEKYQTKRIKVHRRAKATVDYELSVVKTMVSRGIDNDKLDANALKPFRRTKKLLRRRSNARERTLEVQEYLRLLDAAPAHLKPILIVAYNTGMRKGEILGLRWDQVDLKKKMIALSADDTKEEKPKRIPLNHHVVDTLESLKKVPIISRGGGLVSKVFTFHGEPIDDNFRKSLIAACKASGITYGMNMAGGFRFHDIRATVKTNMLRAGVDKALRDIILGHSLEGMDPHYLRPSDDDLYGAITRYTGWLDGQIETVSRENGAALKNVP